MSADAGGEGSADHCTARNAVWIYPWITKSHLLGAPAIVETARSYQLPNLTGMPEGRT